MSDIVDTTEMYIKSIYEMTEDAVVPMRARIVERLKQSGPTVSQTVARLQSHGLVDIDDNRQLSLTEQGQKIAQIVVTKHRYVERLLVDKLGYPWEKAHEEACKWEHVVGDDMLEYFKNFLGDVDTDPYGNPIPLSSKVQPEGVSLIDFMKSVSGATKAVIVRLGEPIQADSDVISCFAQAQIMPGAEVEVEVNEDVYALTLAGTSATVHLDKTLAKHLFVK